MLDDVAKPAPNELFTQADGDHEEYLRLMRLHGHIVPGKRPPGEDVFGHEVCLYGCEDPLTCRHAHVGCEHCAAIRAPYRKARETFVVEDDDEC